ncbi:STAS-like domain-containing protein [Jeotgalibacillus haloalkalitolerans]|uniref:STAS-like domain-containing protein n=1 Tax=Jeotgalibacillus haloalkalitolerans TaxID=3104292 RepID=A0ABU5KM70_9BACL|nr:STAS-like domain-containing protein [Jeotgalibacillus sp. HH7-29]MDZ5712229.1 STAS-like domain-containing protein [Jeotgalibacillus sp. HH7-29]
MGILKISDHVERCYSNHDGLIIQEILRSKLNDGYSVTVSFQGINGVTSSFVNTAFIELLDTFDFSFIKSHVKFADTNSQINGMIKDRFRFEVFERKNATLV